MSSREQIVKAITANKPSAKDLPAINLNEVIRYDELVVQFTKTLEIIGGNVIETASTGELKNEILAEQSAGYYVVNTLIAAGPVDDTIEKLAAFQLEKVHKAYIKGTVAVAENGAVWVYESQMRNRLLPFICQHLTLVVEKKNIVATMHHAYQLIDTAKEGFGVFIAGPSKTADIEQSLVIGAHGARSLTVCLI